MLQIVAEVFGGYCSGEELIVIVLCASDQGSLDVRSLTHNTLIYSTIKQSGIKDILDDALQFNLCDSSL